ncbi:hypothetical protein QFC19_001800 [Naganishia cerealis]|uniref:Uncharacterized protein n=1 Tax=Naganishia cerealis TaxID=610337 RepID=A0ACC2WG32_9TREE|nr:hypothetical protein QFC19_001800 [Naganishia cerealis]
MQNSAADSITPALAPRSDSTTHENRGLSPRNLIPGEPSLTDQISKQGKEALNQALHLLHLYIGSLACIIGDCAPQNNISGTESPNEMNLDNELEDPLTDLYLLATEYTPSLTWSTRPLPQRSLTLQEWWDYVTTAAQYMEGADGMRVRDNNLTLISSQLRVLNALFGKFDPDNILSRYMKYTSSNHPPSFAGLEASLSFGSGTLTMKGTAGDETVSRSKAFSGASN